jgi:hypothetical protein
MTERRSRQQQSHLKTTSNAQALRDSSNSSSHAPFRATQLPGDGAVRKPEGEAGEYFQTVSIEFSPERTARPGQGCGNPARLCETGVVHAFSV